MSVHSSPGSRKATGLMKGLAGDGRGPSLLAVLIVVAGVMAVMAAPVAGSTGVQRTIRLSNERTLSRWAMPVAAAKVRAGPARTARTITRLHYLTEDRQLERYLVLKAVIDRQGRRWLQVRLPMRPNGRKGWVRRAQLGRLHKVIEQLVINRRTLRATLYRGGKRIWAAPVG